MTTPNNNNKLLQNLIKEYLDKTKMENNNNNENTFYELEVKFGTKNKNISRIDYENVIKRVKSLGFMTESSTGVYALNILPNNFNERVEIHGLPNIQLYCKSNNLNSINPNYVKVVNKTKENMVDYDDFQFRVTLSNETTILKNAGKAQELLHNWPKIKKGFRYINRVTFTHPDKNKYPFKIDISIVKSSPYGKAGFMYKHYNINDAGIFTQNSKETFEIEIEVDGTPSQNLYNNLQNMIKIVMCGLQRTNYPISYVEQAFVYEEYNYIKQYDMVKKDAIVKHLKNIHLDEIKYKTTEFLGPSLKTLTVQNILPYKTELNVPNINNNYCVTDKADGERHLLFINHKGRVYLINMNMNVIFTGIVVDNPVYHLTILDGELILHNKRQEFINLFACFDIYYYNGADIRALPLMKDKDKEKDNTCIDRLRCLKDFVNKVNADIDEFYKTQNKFRPLQIVVKRFYAGIPSIFDASDMIWNKTLDNLYDYEIDGLIYTPTLFGVGGDAEGVVSARHKITWDYVFKWKPAEYNTIDFLILTKKDKNSKDIITPIFQEGTNVSRITQFSEYKTIILAVGYDEKYGFINPCQMLLDEDYGDDSTEDEVTQLHLDSKRYKPKKFVPSDPYDADAGITNIMLSLDADGTQQMVTESHNPEVFYDQMIVEFKYDARKEKGWRWIPIRVRYDKTADFRNGLSNYGNNYITANNNWTSIHNPVTPNMICKAEGIPTNVIASDIYYNSVATDSSEKYTERMRNFHNLYVKNLLITSVSKDDGTLMDFACGKAGDLSKWIAAKQQFVFGVDISKDNIENVKDGACARYIGYKRKFKTNKVPQCIFVQGDSSKNIRSGKNMPSDKANMIVKALFDDHSLKGTALDKTVVQKYKGIAINGFDTTSCQFAIHYMFQNMDTFYNFVKNVAECTKVGGYFIATCYDGSTIYQELTSVEKGESIEIISKDGKHKKIWSITKEYDDKSHTFVNTELSLGYKIDVFQDSINQTIGEYLVNANFFIEEMNKFGLSIISDEEAQGLGLPHGTGMFSELFQQMVRLKATNFALMTPDEKKISFLNRYFIFKKFVTRNVDNIFKTIMNGDDVTKDINKDVNKDEDVNADAVEDVNVDVNVDADVNEDVNVVVKKPLKMKRPKATIKASKTKNTSKK